MVSNNGTGRRRTAESERNISRQKTQNIDLQATKTIDSLLIYQTEDVSRAMGSKK